MKIANKADLDAWLFEHAQTQGHTCHGVRGLVPGEDGRVNVAWVDVDTGERFEVVYYDPENLERIEDDENIGGFAEGDAMGLLPHFLHDDSCPSFCDYACNLLGFEQAEMIARTETRDNQRNPSPKEDEG
jgi:hypothetical protein